MRLLSTLAAIGLAASVAAQEPTATDTPTPAATATPSPTATPCPDLTRIVTDASTGLTSVECYSDPAVMTEPTAIARDLILAADALQVDLDYQALRTQYDTAIGWLDLMDQHTDQLAAMTTADLDTVAELRAVIRVMGADLGRLAQIERRQTRLLARIVGGIAVAPQATPTPSPTP